jgi:hypothetical protein
MRIDWNPEFGGTLRLKSSGDESILFMSRPKLRTWVRDAVVNGTIREL